MKKKIILIFLLFTSFLANNNKCSNPFEVIGGYIKGATSDAAAVSYSISFAIFNLIRLMKEAIRIITGDIGNLKEYIQAMEGSSTKIVIQNTGKFINKIIDVLITMSYFCKENINTSYKVTNALKDEVGDFSPGDATKIKTAGTDLAPNSSLQKLLSNLIYTFTTLQTNITSSSIQISNSIDLVINNATSLVNKIETTISEDTIKKLETDSKDLINLKSAGLVKTPEVLIDLISDITQIGSTTINLGKTSLASAKFAMQEIVNVLETSSPTQAIASTLKKDIISQLEQDKIFNISQKYLLWINQTTASIFKQILPPAQKIETSTTKLIDAIKSISLPA